jgi:hypothetical protein
LGRPILYGTTQEFLEHFGFRSLNDLPRPDELPVVLRDRLPLGDEELELSAGGAEEENEDGGEGAEGVATEEGRAALAAPAEDVNDDGPGSNGVAMSDDDASADADELEDPARAEAFEADEDAPARAEGFDDDDDALAPVDEESDESAERV